MIPNKSTFKFQELTPITGVKPYVIRFWETEFEDISPVCSDSGQKLYARKDLEAILKIKKLLFEDKLSVPEARLRMNDGDVEVSSNTSIQQDASSKAGESVHEALELIKLIKQKRNW
jgi:DNA-binding transcriptional MerR regulator